MKDESKPIRDTLSDFREDYSVCGKCKLCQACDVTEVYEGRFWRNCPSGMRFRYEGYYASGRLEMARSLEQYEIEPTPLLVDSLYSCMLCGACQDRCYHVKQIFPMRVFELMREKAVQEGWGPLPAHLPVIENLEKHDNPMGIPRGRRTGWSKDLGLRDASKGAEALLFVGCSYALDPALPDVAGNAASLLQRAGIEVGILGEEELCCGAPALQLGDRDFFEAFAEENIRRISASGADLVVTLCPHCSWVFCEEYAPALDAEVRNVSEVVAQALEDGLIDPSGEERSRVAWHDPCNLGRRLGLYEPPRSILDHMPGLERVELERNKHNALCCGAGGMASVAKPEYGEWVAGERLSEAEFAGVDKLVTGCPHCEKMLRLGAESSGSEVEVENIFSLLAGVVGGDRR